MSPVLDTLLADEVAMASALEQAERFVLEKVAESDDPISPRDLLDQSAGATDFSWSVLRQAIWQLVDTGQVKLTPDWRISKAA
jgi:hypothetical protein